MLKFISTDGIVVADIFIGVCLVFSIIPVGFKMSVYEWYDLYGMVWQHCPSTCAELWYKGARLGNSQFYTKSIVRRHHTSTMGTFSRIVFFCANPQLYETSNEVFTFLQKLLFFFFPNLAWFWILERFVRILVVDVGWY